VDYSFLRFIEEEKQKNWHPFNAGNWSDYLKFKLTFQQTNSRILLKVTISTNLTNLY
jgi:hypothetical protein